MKKNQTKISKIFRFELGFSSVVLKVKKTNVPTMCSVSETFFL